LRKSFSRLMPLAAIACLFLFVRAARAADCGNGVEMKLGSPETDQGSLLLVEVRSAQPLSELAGRWGERDVPFWKEMKKEAGAPGVEVRRALLGVDLEKPAGKYEFTMTAQTPRGEKVSCSAAIEVREGHFATENLTVKKQFVEPNPEQMARAEAESKRLREIYDRVSPEPLWTGKFRHPLDGEFTGSNFGKRRVLNGKPGSPHGGVDFPAPTGTPVHAAQGGRVVLAEELYFAGNTVIVDHGLGIYIFYCHFSEIDTKVGDTVEAGMVLGKVGATGRVTGPHLHWGLTVERARVNALDILKLLGGK
jgi:murein DD-endopeptidase MepM/ murein hydrolase activator NlpD